MQTSGRSTPHMVERLLETGDWTNASPSPREGKAEKDASSPGEKMSRVGRVGEKAPARGGDQAFAALAAAAVAAVGVTEEGRGSWMMIEFAAATFRGLGRREGRRGLGGRGRGVSRGWLEVDAIESREEWVERGSRLDAVEEMEEADPTATFSAKLLIGRYMLKTRVLRFALFSTELLPLATSSFIFFSTSAKTSSIEIPSNRIEGIRMRALNASIEPRSPPSPSFLLARGESSSSASPHDPGEVGEPCTLLLRGLTAFSCARLKGGEEGEGLVDEAERRLRRGGVEGFANMASTKEEGMGVEFLERVMTSVSSFSSICGSVSPLTRHIRCGPLLDLLLFRPWRRGELSGEEVIERLVASELESHSSVKADVDANDEHEVDTVELE